jgi:hypothetical protein
MRDWSFPFPEATSACPPRRAGSCVADTEKPLKSRRSRVRAGPRKGKRGEAPRGVPRAGRSKTLKGKPHGCWAVDGPSSGASRDRGRKPSGADEQGANRREGTQTLRAKGAGEWKPRVNRTCCAGMCRRGEKSTSVDRACGPTAKAVGAMSPPAARVVGFQNRVKPAAEGRSAQRETSRTSQAVSRRPAQH